VDEAVVETLGLVKRYGDVLAVDALDLKVRRGTVFGLLGPNGAGKTTVIGALVGLIRPDGGEVRLFGAPVAAAATRPLGRIGALMETPSFYPHLTGRDNLRYFQGVSGRGDPGEIDRLLDVVGLEPAADLRFATYSLGMKHRLGLAFALLGDPEVLLLDEPTNGLDPRGMSEVRRLIRDLADGQRTVLLASHLLGEVQQVCDEVAILTHGRIAASGAVADLLAGGERLEMQTTDDAAARAVLEGLDWVGAVEPTPAGLVVHADEGRSWELTAALARRGIFVARLFATHPSLEEYFLQVTEREPPR
jgi:ABC-2 type transport system ATP-binding protein